MAGSPRNAAGERANSRTVTAIRPPSQTGNVNVGSGKKENRARIARTAGLYTDRKSVSASSAT